MRSRRKFMMILLTGGMFCAMVSTGMAQSSKGWGIGLQSGISNAYFNESTKINPEIGLNLQYDFSRLFTLNANFHKGVFKSLNAQNYFGRIFRNNYFDFSILPQVNFVNGVSTLKNWRFYGFTGIGIIQNNVTTKITRPGSGDTYKLFEGIDNKTSGMFYTFGLGTRYDISSRIGIYFQYQHNFTNSDYLDGFVTVRGIADPGPRNYQNDNFGSFKTGITIRLGKIIHHEKTPVRSRNFQPDFSVFKDSLLAYKLLVNRYATQIDEMNRQLEKSNELVNELLKLTMKDQLYRQQSAITSLRDELDSLKAQAKKPDTNLANIKKELKRPSNTGKINYYIVADSFLDRTKANSLLSKIKKAGYPNAEVILDESKVWFMVVYSKTTDESRAKRLLNQIRNYQNPTAWMYQEK